MISTSTCMKAVSQPCFDRRQCPGLPAKKVSLMPFSPDLKFYVSFSLFFSPLPQPPPSFPFSPPPAFQQVHLCKSTHTYTHTHKVIKYIHADCIRDVKDSLLDLVVSPSERDAILQCTETIGQVYLWKEQNQNYSRYI